MLNRKKIAESEDLMGKIFLLSEAIGALTDLKTAQKKTVLAHGVFDVMHLGHIKHLKEAKSFGDFLIVSLTPDDFVNKGPGRPVFTVQQRAEVIAALGIVDAVVINEGGLATTAIEALKPNYYVKGSEYQNAAGDVTGGIELERTAVEKYGGQLVFTDDVVFSSSHLINEALDIHDPDVKAYLKNVKNHYCLADFLSQLEKLKTMKVLFVGDMILDEYAYVNEMNRSAKEPIIATRYRSNEIFSGGVVAAANHIASLTGHVDILTMLGGQDLQDGFIENSLHSGVSLDYIVCPQRPTTRKKRYVSSSYVRKLFEVYHFDDAPLGAGLQAEFDRKITEQAPNYDLVIVTDFGHGLVADSTIKALKNSAKFLAVNAQSNSANHGFNLITKYNQADFICIDMPEARLAISDKNCSADDVITHGLAKRIACDNIIVTNGKRGAIAWNKRSGVHHVPAFTKSIVDTVGAGDAFFAVASALCASGAGMDMSALMGNMAGAVKVGIVGHRTSIERAPFIKYLTALLK